MLNRVFAGVAAALILTLALPGTAAAFPGRNGTISATANLWVTQHDGCATNANQTGLNFFSNTLTGRNSFELSEDGYSLNASNARWSPDGKRYTFLTSRSEQIGLVNADGTAANGPQYGKTISVYSPEYSMHVESVAWSPDGQKLAFSTGVALFTVNTDGSNLRFMTWGSYSDISWSPDGEFIAFTRVSMASFPDYTQGVDFRSHVGLIRPDGTDEFIIDKSVPTSFDKQAKWSPDSNKLVFSSNYTLEVESQWDERPQLHIYDLETGAFSQLTDDYTKAFESPVWSPDGTQILATSTTIGTTEPVSLVILNAATGNQQYKYTPECNTAFSQLDWQAVGTTPSTPVPNPQDQAQPLYRMANWLTKERLFTTDFNEVNHIRDRNGWVYEGVAMNVAVTPGDGRTAVYRMANWKTKERLFTTNLSEVNHIKDRDGWVYEGVAFYASNAGIPVYRMANWQTAERLFTTDLNEVQHIRDRNGWVYEGVAYYAPAL